jgi:hypothetical protein
LTRTAQVGIKSGSSPPYTCVLDYLLGVCLKIDSIVLFGMRLLTSNHNDSLLLHVSAVPSSDSSDDIENSDRCAQWLRGVGI